MLAVMMSTCLIIQEHMRRESDGSITYSISICPEESLNECRLICSVLFSVSKPTSGHIATILDYKTHNLSKHLI